MKKLFNKFEKTAEKFFNLLLGKKIVNVIFCHMIVIGLLFYVSKLLGIEILYYETPVEIIQESKSVILKREVGYLWAINWTFYFSFIMTSYIMLFHSVFTEAHDFISKIPTKKMLVYSSENDIEYYSGKLDLWESIVKKLSRWFLALLFISLSVGIANWYQYSGQWYFFGFNESEFLKISTGVDWNVAGSIDALKNSNGLLLTLFALFNYLYYGVGWALMFSFYLFLSILFIELKMLSSATSKKSGKILGVDINDNEYGGFASFGKIQKSHAIFSSISIVSLYLMTVRNIYLPHQCSVPDILSSSINKYEHSEHIVNLLFST